METFRLGVFEWNPRMKCLNKCREYDNLRISRKIDECNRRRIDMDRDRFRKIMCCCGNGVGTSLMMQMTMEEALEKLGISEVNVVFGPLAEASEGAADLFVVSEELAGTLEELPVLGLSDLLDADQAAEKLHAWLEDN